MHAAADTFPRLLILDVTAVGSNSATGQIKQTFLEKWPEDRLLQVYEANGALRLKHWAPGASTDANLLAACRSFRPDAIYFRPTDSDQMFAFAEQVISDLGCPFVVHMMDDWPERLRVQDAARFQKLDGALRRLLAQASTRLSISKAMSETYALRYGGDFVPLANGVDVGSFPARDWKLRPMISRDAPFLIRYMGGLASDMTLASVIDVAEAVASLYPSLPVQLEIFTMSWYLRTGNETVGAMPGVKVHELVQTADYPRHLAQADALLIAYNFDPATIRYVGLSFANKLPECLASGAAVLGYGPRDIATIAYLEQTGCARLVLERTPSALRREIEYLATTPHYCRELGRSGRDYARSMHSKDDVQQAFLRVHQNAAKQGAATRAPSVAPRSKTKTDFLRISLVTPNYNGEKFLETTIDSVLSQGYPNLEYIIVDGKSSDGSMRIVDRYASQLTHVICEHDNGHAHALNKGFALASGEVMGWINSDDVLLPGSLARVNQVFSQFPALDWITGRQATMSESGAVNGVRQVRPWSWLRFLCGDYQHIQQESTFWRRQLWDSAGGALSLRYSLANDFELWARFFRYASLYSVDTEIGCFRERAGQRSRTFVQQYGKECELILAELADAIPVQLLAKYLPLLPSKPVVHPSQDFPKVPAALAVADPPIVRYDDMTHSFSLPELSPLRPPTFYDDRAKKEDLTFDGLERVRWTQGPDFRHCELTGLDVELRSDHAVLERAVEFGDSTPPMPLVAGPIALYQIAARTYFLQISYSGMVIGLTVKVESADGKMRLKVALSAGRYGVWVNGKILGAGDLSGVPVAAGRYVKLGGGYLSRYWVGMIDRIGVTFQSRSSKTPVSKTCAITHDHGARNFSREFKGVIDTPPSSHAELRRFRNIHPRQRCFVMGNGPSLNKMDLEKLRGEMVFACNGAFLLLDRISWRPRYYTCVDSRVIRDRASDIARMLDRHPDMIAFFPATVQLHDGTGRTFEGRSIIPPKANRYYFHEVANSLEKPPQSMFSLDIAQCVVQPFTVAITMLQLAAYMGFSEIYLIGCDTEYRIPDSVTQEGAKLGGVGLLLTSTKDDDTNHFDPRYFGQGRQWHNPQVEKMIEHHRWAYEALRQAGIQVFNATVGGRLEVYPRVNFDSLFDKATGGEERATGEAVTHLRQEPTQRAPAP